LEVVEALDGPLRGAAPVVSSKDGGALDRRLAAVCLAVTQKERKILAGVTVADLAKRRRQSK
jgi:hypothetical protein